MSVRFKFDELDELDMDDMRLEQQALRWHRHKLAAHPDCRDPDHPGCAKCLGDDCEVEAEDLDCVDELPASKRVANVCWPILLACAFFAVMAGAVYPALLLVGVSVAVGGYAARIKHRSHAKQQLQQQQQQQ